MILKIKTKNQVQHIVSPLFEKHGIPHAFTTSRGGVSAGDFATLNVSTRRADRFGNFDRYENTVENFSRALSVVGATPESSVSANQVHGKKIIRINASHGGMGILKSAKHQLAGDGLFLSHTEREIRGLCVKSADCTPVLFANTKNGDICAVHSGWRGTCLDIVGEAVRVMLEEGKPENIICAIGPCISDCCYEVSDDVYACAYDAFLKKGIAHLTDAVFKNRRETAAGVKYHFNIGKMCVLLAEYAGIPGENIDYLDICTCCSYDKDGRIFFSHRGQGGYSGTFASVIGKF